MTSADVVASLDRYREPAFSTEAEYADVASVDPDGPYTVVITLKQPDAAFESTLAWQGAIFEKSFFLKHQSTFGDPGTLVEGTGPWEVDSFDPTTSEELSANPAWWGGKVNIQHISIRFFASETSEALAFRAGEIDVAFPTSAEAFASASGAKLVSVPANSIGFFGMNTKVAPWDDLHVRRAVAYALNKPELIKADANPGTPVSTLIPPAQLDLLAPTSEVNAIVGSIPSYPYDLAKAKQEMAESAYPHGFTAESDTISSVPSFVNVTEAIAAMLQKIGINLQVKDVPDVKWSNEMSGPIKGGKGGDVYTTFNLPSPDPSSYPSFMLGSTNVGNGGWDWANYDPPQVDTLIKEGNSSQASATRLAIYAKMLRILATDVPYVPLFIADYNMAISSKFSYPGFNQNYLRTAWALGLRPR
jgi:peptide/nickel transport system substrate-binding protein